MSQALSIAPGTIGRCLRELDEGEPPAGSGRRTAGGTVSVLTLNEFASVAHRKFRLSWPEASTASSNVRSLCSPVVPLGIVTHEAAVEVATRGSVAFYNALIVASALEAGCDALVTEELQGGRKIETRLPIHHPFRG